MDSYYQVTSVDSTQSKFISSNGFSYQTYQEGWQEGFTSGYTPGYNNGKEYGFENPILTNWISSAFDAVGKFLAIPVMGSSITIGGIIGALFVISLIVFFIGWFR